MELTINVEDLSDLQIYDSNGILYSLVSQHEMDKLTDKVEDLSEKLEEATVEFVTQRKLLKRVGISRETLKSWVAEGLHEIPMGSRIYFDLKEVNDFIRSKKI